MSSRATATLASLLALSLPAAAEAQTGGASPSEPPPPPPQEQQAPPPGAAPAGNSSGIVLLPLDATVRSASPLRGTAAPGQDVAVQSYTRAGGWAVVATATAAADGTFAAAWKPRSAGRRRLRAVAAPRDGASARAASASPEVTVTVFRPALASYYGPGFYGRRTACGHKMSTRLVGVAHKTLPCGTQVALKVGDRTATVPVVDRGPFKPGRTYDLTAATAFYLGFKGLERIGAVALRGLPRAPSPIDAPPTPYAKRRR